MAPLPDPTDHLDPADRAVFDRMAAARSHAEGRSTLGEVYVRMFNNPGVAEKVGALGEHLRFSGVLPDAARELTILRFACRSGSGYEWSHHQRPARLAGLDEATITAITAGQAPDTLPVGEQAVLAAVDAVVARESIPTDVQSRIVGAYGEAGVVEVVVLCGLYSIMGYTVTAFDIPLEEDLPPAPF